MKILSGYKGNKFIPDNPTVSDVEEYLKDFGDRIVHVRREDYDDDTYEDYLAALADSYNSRHLYYVDNFPYFNDFHYMLTQYTTAHDPDSPDYDCDAQYRHVPDLYDFRDTLLKAWNGCGFTVNGRNIYDCDEILEYFISLGVSVEGRSALMEVMSPTSEFCDFWDSFHECFKSGFLRSDIERYYESHRAQIEEYYRIKSC